MKHPCLHLPITLTILYLSGALSGLSIAARALPAYLLAASAALLSGACTLLLIRAIAARSFAAGHLAGWQAKNTCAAYEQQLHHQHYITHPKPYNPHEYDH